MKLPANPITAWSYSRYSVFYACKLQFKFKFIEKIEEEKGPALIKGNRIHLGIQKFLDRKAKNLPAEIRSNVGPELQQVYAQFKKERAGTELQFAVNSDWEPVEWFSRQAWLRVVYDVFKLRGDTAVVGDHKTGKIRPDQHAEQLETYAIAIPAKWPDIREIVAQMYYVDAPDPAAQITTAVFKISDIPKLRKKWEKRAAPIFKEREFRPTPGQACRYCAYSQKRGGPCKYG
jgi:hypothetical protein